MSTMLPKEFVQQAIETFEKLDSERSGFLETNEITEAFDNMRLEVNRAHVDDMLKKAKLDSKEKLSLSEYMQLLEVWYNEKVELGRELSSEDLLETYQKGEGKGIWKSEHMRRISEQFEMSPGNKVGVLTESELLSFGSFNKLTDPEHLAGKEDWGAAKLAKKLFDEKKKSQENLFCPSLMSMKAEKNLGNLLAAKAPKKGNKYKVAE